MNAEVAHHPLTGNEQTAGTDRTGDRIGDRTNRSEHARTRRSAFTLVEMLAVLTIIALISSTVLVAMWGVMQDAKADRTRSEVARLHSIVMEQYESYRTRSVPLRLPVGTSPRAVAMLRLHALRELMRMELPDRRTDIMDRPAPFASAAYSVPAPALWQAYNRRVAQIHGPNWADVPGPPYNPQLTWTPRFQGAECLYMILAEMRTGGVSALDYFAGSEIGDVDGDGMKEILDAWGNPIEFVRWAPGVSIQTGADRAWGVVNVDDNLDGQIDDYQERGAASSDDFHQEYRMANDLSEIQIGHPDVSSDPLDPLHCHAEFIGADGKWGVPNFDDDGDGTVDNATEAGWGGDDVSYTFALFPLIFSAGADKQYDLTTDVNYSSNTAISADSPEALLPATSASGTPRFPNTYGVRYQNLANVPAHANNVKNLLVRNNPYLWFDVGGNAWQLGKPTPQGFVRGGFRDNIHNHLFDLK